MPAPTLIQETKICCTCRKELSLSFFRPNKGGKYGRHSKCRKCEVAYAIGWNKAHPEKFKEICAKTYKYNGRDKHLRRHYGITEQMYGFLFKEQEGKCKICGLPPKEGEPLHVDHNHQDSRVRGLLCKKCNVAIGLFNDDRYILQKAIEYLS